MKVKKNMKRVKHCNLRLLKRKKNYYYIPRIYKSVKEMLKDSKEIVLYLLVSNKNK